MGVTDAEHDALIRPASEALLWRYVDLSKYLSLLSTESLWFSRTDYLGDPFEGSTSRANVRLRPKVSGLQELRQEQYVQTLRRLSVRHYFISCWHCSEWESAAMWKLYLRDHGIAIVTSYERMRRALGGDDEIWVGFVRYVDYDDDLIPEPNGFSRFMHKRRSFEHEREVRAIFSQIPTRPDRDAEGGRVLDYSLSSPPGIAVPVDLGLLVAEVRVAPDAPTWFADVVSDVSRRYKVDYPVTQSTLGGEPVY